MKEDGKSCIQFTPLQYISIYYSRLQHEFIKTSGQLNAICLLILRTRNWQVKNNNNCS